MFSFGKKPQFTRADAVQFFQLAQSRIAERTGPLYTTLNGCKILTQKYVLLQVTEMLQSLNTNLDKQSIATTLDLSTQAIDEVLSTACQKTGSYAAEHGLILPKPRIIDILSAIKQKKGLVLLSDVCVEEKVTMRALIDIIKRDSALILANDAIISASQLDEYTKNMQSKLENAEEPVKYADLEDDKNVLVIIKQKLGVPSHETTFIPEKYTEKVVSSAVKTLDAQGYVLSSSVSEVKSAAKVAKEHDSVVLGDKIVSNQFIASAVETALAKITETGFYNLKDLVISELRPVLANDDKLKKFKCRYETLLLNPGLEKETEQLVLGKLEPIAQREVDSLQLKTDGSTTVASIVDKLALPTEQSISEFVSDDFPTHVLKGICPAVRTKYLSTLSGLVEAKLDAETKQIQAKCRAYLNGLQSLPNSSLKTAAWEEWLQYVNEYNFSVPSSEEDAIKQFNVSSELVQAAVGDIVNVAKQQIQRTSNAAKVLYLAALVYHSRHFSETGVLKLSSKYLPKLLGLFEFPNEFKTLREQLKKPTNEAVNAVKSTVL